MTNEELVCRLVKSNEEMKDVVLKIKQEIVNIKSRICGIGGPLNDNKLEFNSEQRKFIRNIIMSLDLCEDFIFSLTEDQN